ncbi:hypothetical protein ACH4UM_18785 [Streptomyces sp. NPDC020801]|uniref:hypothetical protein n=1 Tax=Streptomyces sp. NPDC020801 TaxID=3365093 RepID=UPI0037A628A8
MAEFTSETVTRTVHRWIVPAAEPWGAASAEINKAWAVAAAQYRAAYGIGDSASIAGDALRFHVRDEAIVIEFTTEERTA